MRRSDAGFTLAELMVATILLTLVMTAVYTGFSSSLRAWRLGEANMNTLQTARTTMTMIARELNCVLPGAAHMFQGKDDEIEFIAVTPPMDVEKNDGERVLWVRYTFSRNGHKLTRREAVVESAIPPAAPEGQKIDRERMKMTRKKKFDLAADVKDFKVTYIWVPPEENMKEDEPPQYVEPIEMDRNEEGWGIPRAVKIALTIKDPNSPSKETTFTTMVTFRAGWSPYDDKKIGTTGKMQ